MSLAEREDYAADAREDAQRLAQAPAATALLRLSGVLAVRASAASAGLAQGNLERLDQRIYACEAQGRDLTTAAICEALVILAGEAGAVRAREAALGLPSAISCEVPADPLRERLRAKLRAKIEALISDLRGLQTHNEGEVRWDGDRFCAGRAEAYQDCADQLAALVTPTPQEPNHSQHYCQRPPGMACDNIVDCATAAAGDFCDGPEPHLCASCQGDRK